MNSRPLAALGALVIAAVALTACDSGTDAAPTAEATTGAQSALAAEVDKLTKPLDAYPVPTATLDNVRSLAGRTVYYVPITMQSPQFKVTLSTLTKAFDTVGIKVQACDGKGTPTDVSACRPPAEAPITTISCGIAPSV